ncbi:unnamed protein product [Porites evermanni]|uniref:Uncharacterized protein n=1 Tax=Porites evermanni TaxID=104178 RepID=A0ABN8ME24_9CNID|nr:unnamed protein product [Porites evermanni]
MANFDYYQQLNRQPLGTRSRSSIQRNNTSTKESGVLIEILKSVGSKLIKPTVGNGELCAQTLLSFSAQKPIYLQAAEFLSQETQDVGGTPPFQQFIRPEPATPENQSASACACESPCTSNASGSPDSASTENVNYLESKDARKVWERIAPELSAKCGTKKTNDKCQQTMKYWIDRYKAAKIWIRNQSGGNRKQSIFYKEINEVLGCRDGI